MNIKIVFKLTFLILLSIAWVVLFDSKSNQIANAGFTSEPTSKVNSYWTNRSTSLPPNYVMFKSGTPQYTNYMNQLGYNPQIWEERYNNMFLWYSIAEHDPEKQTDANMDMYKMYENRVKRVSGTPDYWKLVDASWNQNLKLGSTQPGKQAKDTYNGDNTGTTLITGSKYYGKNYEWRYLGYAYNGTVIPNPYFPADYPPESDSTYTPQTKNWIEFPWDSVANVTKGPYDISSGNPYVYGQDPIFTQKVDWFVKYFFDQNPKFLLPGKSKLENAIYWAKRFSLFNNPEYSTGIVTGWHKEDGVIYYTTFIFKTPPTPNLRVIEYKVTDKETGKVVGLMTMNPDDNDSIYPTWNINNQEVEVGKTYTITATIKNMIVDGLSNHPTGYTPIRLETMASLDDDSNKKNVWTNPYQPKNNVIPSVMTTSIPYGGTTTFNSIKNTNGTTASWEFTVPNTVKKEFVLATEIDPGFYEFGDNTYTADDIGRLRFKVKQEDIGLTNNAELIDSNGNAVNSVIPGQTYSLRFYVKKYMGDKKVGDPADLTNNPYASVDVTVTDKGSVSKTYNKVQTRQTITANGQVVQIDVPNAITPRTSVVQATWKLDPIHAQKAQSTDLTNDGPLTKTWASEVNISVNNFSVNPTSVMLPVGQSSTVMPLTFNFDINNTNQENQQKSIKVVIKKNGTSIWSGNVNVPANIPYHQTVTVSNVSLSAGSTNPTDTPFTVEVNPAPRTWVEYLMDGSDPYADNIASTSLPVHTNVAAKYCNTVHTSNSWTVTHHLSEWWGHSDYYWVYPDEELGQHFTPYKQYYCVTDRRAYPTQTVNYYETYTISDVLFKSKITTDNNQGSGGWISILNQPGKVKAGYGFEIKYLVTYNTNTYSASPKAWQSGCDGMSYTPYAGSSVTSPSTIQVTMPFTDSSGQPVRYNLTATSSSGSWDNMTRTFEMPQHNAFGLVNTRQVFVNSGARDGNYSIRIDTAQNFYGSSDKPATSVYLCDTKFVTIQIIGADSDDIKSHVTQ